MGVQQQLLRLTTEPKPIVFSSLLHECTKSSSFSTGLRIHTYLLKSGLDSDRYVGNSLLSLYFKLCPDVSCTRKVFDNLHYKDTISWTSMLSAYVRARRPFEAIHVFRRMLHSGRVEPNAFTLSVMIKGLSNSYCAHLFMHARCFHAMVFRLGFGSNHVIACALVDMYGRNFAPDDAFLVFNEMLVPDAIGWTSIISACTRNDRFHEAVALFYAMQHNYGLVPDEYTFGTILTALGNLSMLRQGKEVHAKVIAFGNQCNVVVSSSIVDMYAKCGVIIESQRAFDQMSTKNAISWCALLGGYCQSGDYDSVLRIFHGMDRKDHNCSFGTVLRACTGLLDVKRGKQVHGQFLRTRCQNDVIIESALVDLYAKCGFLDYADRVFQNIEMKNLITWNTMICGFARSGRGRETVDIFNNMVKEGGIKPDYISFIGVLFACSHSGFVEEGKKYFMSMINDYKISARLEHYNCMVDLLGRAELLEEAEALLNSAPFTNESSLWLTLLGACTTFSNPNVAERVAKKVIELEPDYHLSYILLANIYKTVGRWDDALQIRKLMKDKGIRKSLGKSWIGSLSFDENRCGDSWNVGLTEDVVLV